MNYKSNNSRGFIKTIILVIIALALLKFVFDFDIIDFLKKPEVSEWFKKGWDFIVGIWDNYIARLFWFAYDQLVGILSKLWELILSILEILNRAVDKMPSN